MELVRSERKIPVIEDADVLVVGGGPAGVGAAVSAARLGSRVLLLEKRGFLGGNITSCYVENCNYFLSGTPFESEGVYAEIEQSYRARFGCDDVRPDSGTRFNSEYLKVFLDDFVARAGVKILFHAFVNEVIRQGDHLQAVVVQTKRGPAAVRASVVVDTTGDGDVAFSAGVPFEQGREKDGLCQPGTVSMRVAGADARLLRRGDPEHGDLLRRYGRQFRADYRAGKTNLSCKRQDLPFGRLTAGGQISYVNYACAYGIDPTSIYDLTRGEMECRRYDLEILQYMRGHFAGMEGLEVSSLSPEIGFRDSRRIRGLYRLTIGDMESSRAFEDVIAVFPRFYDMLAPDADMTGDGSVEGGGYRGHIFEPVRGDRTFQVPYRSLIPVQTDNLLTAGRCISADHVAQSGVRAISLCAMTGQAAGAAAHLAARQGCRPQDIAVAELQDTLRAQAIRLP